MPDYCQIRSCLDQDGPKIEPKTCIFGGVIHSAAPVFVLAKLMFR